MPFANCFWPALPYYGLVTELHRNLIRVMKRRRKALALSQAMLAEKAGISSGYVGEVEMGRKYPSPEILEQIAAALEVRPYRLLMSDEDVAEAAGREAVYAAADSLKRRLGDRLGAELDEWVREVSPREGRNKG